MGWLISLLLFPFKLVGGIISAVFGLTAGILGIVFAIIFAVIGLAVLFSLIGAFTSIFR